MSIRTHRIELPTPYLVGPVNVHLVLGDAAVLIDSGPRSPECEEILLAGVRKAGVEPKDIDAILITHAHLDHFGMAARLRELTGARVFAHKADRVYLEAFPRSHHRAVDRFRDHARRHGLSSEVFEAAARHYSDSLEFGDPVEVDEIFGEKEPVSFGSIQLEPVFTPGHTAGSTCLVETSSRVLFSGDTVLEHITPISFFRGRGHDTGVARFTESLARLRELDVKRVHPGHQKNFPDLAGTIDRIGRHIEIRRKRVIDALSPNEGKTAEAIARYAFGSPKTDVEKWVGFVETLGLLETLVDEGRAREAEEGFTSRFFRMD